MHFGNGAVEVAEIPRADWPSARSDVVVNKKFLYRWVPPRHVLPHLPDWFDLCLICDVGESGMRWFSPVGTAMCETLRDAGGLELKPFADAQGFSFLTSTGGHAILVARDEIEEDLPFTYHEARLFLQYVWHMREYLGSTVKLGRVLSICAGGRADRGTRDILPEDLGLDAQGNGVRWGPRELRAEGLRGALDAGIENPNPEEVLRYGLLAAAMRNPLPLRSVETQSLVRMALFDFGPADSEVTPEDLGNVAAQVKNSLKDHLDDSTETFDRWLEDPKSNLIHRIAKRKDCRLDRKQVRKVLLELGWRSIKMLGRCVDKQMRVFREAFPQPLSEAESPYFEQVFVGHPAFGDLPFLLIHDRFEFLNETILRMWNRPNDARAVAIVHRMMLYYGELVSTRRASDRLYKQRAKVETATGHVAREEPILGEVAVPGVSHDQRVFKEAAFRLAVARGADLGARDDEWDARLLDATENRVVFCVFCEQRRIDETHFVTLDEFAFAVHDVAAELAGEEDSHS